MDDFGKYEIQSVAKWFLKKDSMTLKRLQKLCYYAQAWYFTLKGKKLANTEFEAWVHGPVSRDLWNDYKSLYSEGLYMADISVDTVGSQYEDISDLDDIELLDMVWDTYGDLTGNALEALTHTEAPWQKARAGYKPSDSCNKEISLDDMKEYYLSIYEGDYGE